MITLAASGFIGRIGAGMIPAENLANTLGLYVMPDYLFLSLLSIAMIPVSYLGVSPIMMAVFFGSILGALPILPADPTLVALAISSGWAISMTTSPFATVVLIRLCSMREHAMFESMALRCAVLRPRWLKFLLCRMTSLFVEFVLAHIHSECEVLSLNQVFQFRQ